MLLAHGDIVDMFLVTNIAKRSIVGFLFIALPAIDFMVDPRSRIIGERLILRML